MKTLKKDLREALDVLRAALKKAKPDAEDGGLPQMEKVIRDGNVLLLLREVATAITSGPVGRSATTRTRAALGAISPAKKNALLTHIVTAMASLWYMSLMGKDMVFEEAEMQVEFAIEDVSEALEIALGLSG